MILPIAMTDAILTSCTVPEAVVTEYAGGSTYALGDIRGVTTGTAQIVYQSLQAANTGNTPASSPLWWQVLGTVYAAYAGGTTYAAADIVTDLANHDLYESVAGSNLGNALSNTLKWTPLGKTNRWKQFDRGVYTQTTAPETITQVITPGTLANALVLLNVEGTTATLEQSASGYSRTVSLVNHDVLNWYDWFYQEPVRAGDAAFTDIPPYAAATLTLTISNPGGEAAIGGLFFGKSRTVGTTSWGLTGGILSYSTSTTDTFGNVTLVRRANAKRLNFDVHISPGYESEAYRLLTAHTDVEIVIIGAENYSMTFSYGFLGQWSVPVTNSGKPASIEFKGLT
jgi:hypothetical protein